MIAAIIAGKAPVTSERKSFNIPPRSTSITNLVFHKICLRRLL
jgi:hypothetical protein